MDGVGRSVMSMTVSGTATGISFMMPGGIVVASGGAADLVTLGGASDFSGGPAVDRGTMNDVSAGGGWTRKVLPVADPYRCGLTGRNDVLGCGGCIRRPA